MNLNCCCDTCGQHQMDFKRELMDWGIRITWHCVETKIIYAWAEVKSE